MIPPQWALTEGTRLDLDQFQEQFYVGWSRLSERFLKIECWQEYQELVPLADDTRLPREEFFDFLLFDRHTALIHDYGTGDVGLQTGGWVTHDASVIAVLDGRGRALREAAIPLRSFSGPAE